jgi:pyridoxamine 5'-phosphate oxidase
MDERDLDPDPLRQLAAWYAEAQAAGVAQPDAMTLATATRDGRPSARMVLLKGIDARGVAFYTNRESRKGRDLAANPRAALVLHWQAQGRQARVEGEVEELSRDEVETYWRTRPRASRLAARASEQSRPIASRAALDARFADEQARHPGDDVPLPPFWGGYRVVADVVEFWVHRQDRLHDRFSFERGGDGWRSVRLQP